MTSEIILRPWSLNDLESLIENANDPDIANYMTDGFPFPYTEEHGRKFIENNMGHHPVHIYAIALNDKAIGGIGIHPQTDIMRKNAELGYWLGKKHWGKGIVTTAVRLIIPIAFQNFDITRLYARPFGSNKASQRILEKTGFKREARIEGNIYKNGRFEDELFYAIRKEEVQTTQ